MRRTLATGLFVMCLVSGLPSMTFADTNVASTLIPFNAMTPGNRLLVCGVTDHYTLRREYPVQRFAARKDQLEFLMDHLDACSTLAQSFALITYRATQGAQGRIYADDHEGATGYILQALKVGNKRVYYVEGNEHGIFDVSGRGVAVIDFVQPKPGTIDYTGAMFVKVDNVVLAALTQLFSMFLRGTVDHHYKHVMEHPIVLSKMAYENPQAMLARIEAMPKEDRTLLQPFAEMLQSQSVARPDRF